MRIVFIGILLSRIIISCTPSYISDVNRIIDTQTKIIVREENLEVFASGGAMMDSITKINLCFVAYRRVDVNEARNLVVKCIEKLANAINATENLRSFLNPYPFPRSSMEIGIMFLKESGEYVDHGCAYLGNGGVSLVDQINGNLFYSSYNSTTGLLERYYNEPYEVALAIVRGEIPAPEIECSVSK